MQHRHALVKAFFSQVAPYFLWRNQVADSGPEEHITKKLELILFKLRLLFDLFFCGQAFAHRRHVAINLRVIGLDHVLMGLLLLLNVHVLNLLLHLLFPQGILDRLVHQLVIILKLVGLIKIYHLHLIIC